VLAGSPFGDWLGLLAVTALASTLADDSYAKTNLAVAGVLILRLGPAVLLGTYPGRLAARMNRKVVLVAADLLRALLFVTIPLVGSLTWLFVATALIGAVGPMWAAAKEATVPDLVPRRDLGATHRISLLAAYGTAPVAALVFSALSLLTGLLDNAIDPLGTHPLVLALYATALTFAVSGLVTARLPIPKRRAPGPGPAIGSLTTGWRVVGATPVARGLVVGMLLALAAAGSVIGLAPIYVRDLGAGHPGYGVLFAAVFLGLALGRWAGPHVLDGFSRLRLFGLSLVAAGLFLGAIALIPNLVMAALLTVGLGACCGTAWTTGQTLLAPIADATVRARTSAFLTSAARVALVLVLAVELGLAAVIGRHTINFTDAHALAYNGAAFVFLIAAVLTLALGVAAYRRMDDRPGTRLGQDLRVWWSSHRTHPAAEPHPEYPGVFIALEGGDGSGKSTQARLLADWLRSDQGHDVVLTREPGATPLGVRLREVLLGNVAELGSRAEALLFAADRAHHVEAVVRPALARGSIVVTDRYIDSSVAYQGAGRELDGDEVERISGWATDGLVPALTVLLDVDPVISKSRRARDLNRGGEDRLESETDAFHDRVRGEFLALARRAPHRYLVLDAGTGAEEVQYLIRERVRQVLPVSARRRAELDDRLAEEERTRERRAAAEAEVLRMDADLRRRRVAEAHEREESRRRARDEAERQLQQEAERELRDQESQRNREEVDRRASAAAAAAALGPVTEPVQMPNPYPARRPAEPQPSRGEPQDVWAPPADPTRPLRPVQPQQYEGTTAPVPPTDQPDQELQAGPPAAAPRAPRTIQIPEVDLASLGHQSDRTITLPDGETGGTGETEETGPQTPLRRRGRRQA